MRVESENHFAAYAAQFRLAQHRALEQAALVGLEAVKATPTNYNIASVMDAVFASGVEQTAKGLGVWLIAGDWKSLFFERGTYTRHRGKLKQPRRSSRGNRGVKAGRFLRHGARAGIVALVPLLERECARIRL